MLDTAYESVASLIHECEQLAMRRFHQRVSVHVALVPCFGGNLFAAEVHAEAPHDALVEASRARRLMGALIALRAQLRAQTV